MEEPISDNMEEPISAFAMYAAKRKKTEQLLSKKKKKQKTFEQKDVKLASIKQETGCKDVINKLKLKIMKEEYKKNKKAAKKRVTVQIIHAKSKQKGTESRENILNDANSSHLNTSINTSINSSHLNTNLNDTDHPLCANIEINKHDHRNPVEDCGQLFKWLVYPMTIEQFFT